VNTNTSESWERPGWQLIGVLATLIILMSCWVALENAIDSVVAFVNLMSKPSEAI
jgi:hypothetical protein